MFVIGPLWLVVIVTVVYVGYRCFRPRTILTVIPNWDGPAATEWITYTGASPPLRLKICLAGSEAFRQAVATAGGMPYTMVEQLPDEQQAAIYVRAIANTFVVDWEMAGRPYSNDVMAQMLAADVNLGRFIFNDVKRRST